MGMAPMYSSNLLTKHIFYLTPAINACNYNLYDISSIHADIVDSSGMSFYYTSTKRTFDAGSLFLGHSVTRSMIIPPGAQNYRVFGECSSDCTSAYVSNSHKRLI